MGNSDRSPAPPGAMQEVRFELIEEGAFQQRVNRILQRSVAELLQYESEHGDKTGCIEINAKIKIRRQPDTRETFRVEAAITTKVPSPKSATLVKEAGGKLLIQPVGSNDDPNQQEFFDSKGRPINAEGHPLLIDETPPAVAGRIPSKTAAVG